ncbi:hypothetical protein KP509_06G072000 [Ceratopteris richardii]|nr:hypothetical protein KP509_06G072000 [Ceratopteris richardii]
MKNIRPEEMAEMSSMLANASPEQIASMQMHADAQLMYELRGAQSLKDQGNDLHGKGMYKEAIEKYSRGKRNLVKVPTAEAAKLQLACSLNLMSCYLKTGEFQKAIEEGTEVLERDPKNLKALYRRGQAYRELGQLRQAFKDISKAAAVDPDDTHVKLVLRQIEEQLEIKEEGIEEGAPCSTVRNGLTIEEIIEEEIEAVSPQNSDTEKGKEEEMVQQSIEAGRHTSGFPDTSRFAETVDALKQNPEMIRSMHSMMSNMDPNHIAAMSGGQMTPEMVKLATDMIKHMSPEDMERMLNMMPGQNHNSTVIPPSQGSSSNSVMDRSKNSGKETLDSPGVLNYRTDQTFPTITPDMQEQMQQTMKNPAMKEMMTSMLRNMSPGTMAAMSEQMGYKLSKEEAERAQKALSSLSPDVIEKMMKWADRAQQATRAARRGKDFLLGKGGLALAIVFLIIAVLLNYFGVIGG